MGGFTVINLAQAAGQPVAREAFGFDTLEAAKSNHFYFLSSAYANSNLVYFMSCVLNSSGGTVSKEVYIKEA